MVIPAKRLLLAAWTLLFKQNIVICINLVEYCLALSKDGDSSTILCFTCQHYFVKETLRCNSRTFSYSLNLKINVTAVTM